jgi:hypothetical protein
MRTQKEQRADMRFARKQLADLQSEFEVILRSPKGTVVRRDALERIMEDVDFVTIHVQHCDPENVDEGWHDARDELEQRVRAELDSELGKCCVCLEPMLAKENDVMDPDAVSRLPCNHRVHTRCAIRVLRASGKCPLCRAPFVASGMMFTAP